MLFLLILLFGLSSYFIGVKEILAGKYAPSVFSRIVWLLLAIISFASVLAIDSTKASVVLAGILLVGNASICFTSFWKGTKEWGRLEYVCLSILVISGLVLVLFKAPLVSLAIGLFAHFIGAIPTYKRVLTKPESESTGFWSLFFVASVLSVIASLNQPLRLVIFPIYFTFFDGSMTFLSMRKKSSNSSN